MLMITGTSPDAVREFALGAFCPRRLKTSLRLAFFHLFVLVFGAGAVLAQADANSADLRGHVRDPNGAVVVGATVTARNPAINFSREATTNEEGFYQIVQ